MDGVTAQKLVFFLGATNRPDIIDPALMRPGRLDSLIYIGLPDFEARIAVFKAALRKSPVDPEVDYYFFADRTEGFSGADIAGVCKNAAKNAIRSCINQERRKWEAKEAKKKAAEEKGEEYHSDEEKDDEPDPVPYITKKMLLSSLSGAKISVTKADLEKHMKYKRDLERRLGMDEGGGEIIEQKSGPIIGLEPERRPAPGAPSGGAPARTPAPAAPAATPTPAAPAAPRTFDDSAQDDSIYDS